MRFPPLPQTDDERRTELIRLMSVRGYPNVYLLGCFARYVTIYAQQVRALNLVDALARSGVLTARSRIAVIGGGIAGMTAAAAAAVRGVARVEVFERSETTMRLQRTCTQRFVHPFVYDWPQGEPRYDHSVPAASGSATPGSGLARVDAHLPVMNWSAETADRVVADLDQEWEKVRAARPDVLREPRTSCGKIGIEPGTPCPIVRIANEPPQEFDVVILAVGFGSDARDGGRGYWNDLDVDGPDVPIGKRWVVSGAGDGGLTDLMRLCISTFRHADVLEKVDHATWRKVEQRLMTAEDVAARTAAAAPPAEAIATRYEALRPAYDEALQLVGADLDQKLPARNLGEVFLVASERDLVAGGASVLNRMIAYYLLKAGRFKLLGGRIRSVEPVASGAGWHVVFEGDPGTAMDTDYVLVRHGPRSALEAGFPEIYARCRGLRRAWAAARQHEDWTRTRLFDDRDFTLGQPAATPLNVDFGHGIGTVVVSGSTRMPGSSLKTRVSRALARARPALEPVWGRAMDPGPVELSVSDAFASPAAYERAVRALCTAEIAVFDLTAYPPGTMLLLGIRAAVRRGVTVTVTQRDAEAKALPFNVAALNPVRVGHQFDYRELAEAIQAGARGLRSDPHGYLDLPAFDALRQTGAHRTIPPSRQILFLCWFNDTYRNQVFDALAHPLEEVFAPDGGELNLLTTLDSRSPQLVEQRLYAEIRRTQLCVVDWTGFRPNVFFELGVRLAVSRTDPLCVAYRAGLDDDRSLSAVLARDSDGAKPVDEAVRAIITRDDPQLRTFFAPIEFDVEDSENVSAALRRIRDQGAAGHRRGVLSPGRTHRVVSEALNRAPRPGGPPVESLLAGEAERLAGPSVPEEGELPVLFGDVIAGPVRRAAVEHLVAAWYYLDGWHRLRERHEQGTLSADDPNLRVFLSISGELRDRLQAASGERYAQMADEVDQVLAKFTPAPPETEVVNLSRWLKAQALDLRRKGGAADFDRALELLAEAEHLLRQTLATLEKSRDPLTVAEYRRDVLRQLPHVLGSRGGVLRARGDDDSLRRSATAYEAGYAVEQRLAELGIDSSYNMVQRLVARALLEPSVLEPKNGGGEEGELLKLLHQAHLAIQDQIGRGRGGDVYAAADLALVDVMLGVTGWEDTLERFLDGPPVPTAHVLVATRSVIDRLRSACSIAGDGTPALDNRLKFASEEIGIELEIRA